MLRFEIVVAATGAHVEYHTYKGDALRRIDWLTKQDMIQYIVRPIPAEVSA